jgi:hypothetical protein
MTISSVVRGGHLATCYLLEREQEEEEEEEEDRATIRANIGAN